MCRVGWQQCLGSTNQLFKTIKLMAGNNVHNNWIFYSRFRVDIVLNELFYGQLFNCFDPIKCFFFINMVYFFLMRNSIEFDNKLNNSNSNLLFALINKSQSCIERDREKAPGC